MDANEAIKTFIVRADQKFTPVMHELQFVYKTMHSLNTTRRLDDHWQQDMLRKIEQRFRKGLAEYGHGIDVHADTRQWGTVENNWLESCEEEVLDAIIYCAAFYVKNDSAGPIKSLSHNGAGESGDRNVEHTDIAAAPCAE